MISKTAGLTAETTGIIHHKILETSLITTRNAGIKTVCCLL